MLFRQLVLLLGLATTTLAASVPRNRIPTDGEPTIAHVGLVRPDIVSITIVEGRNVRHSMRAYEAQEGDQLVPPKKSHEPVGLRRGGRMVGAFSDASQTFWRPNDEFAGRLIDPATLAEIGNYQLVAKESGDMVSITAVSRKSTVLDYGCLNQGRSPFENIVFLHLAEALPKGESYDVQCRFTELQKPENSIELNQSFSNTPHRNRSIAVHVNQLGYHPGDPAKTAYLSCWTGDGPDGGNVAYPDDLGFAILNLDTGKPVEFGDGPTAKVRLRRSRDQTEDSSWYKYAYADTAPDRYNASKVDVFDMDFSGLSEPGRYVVYVENVGVSYPFVIHRKVWQRAFAHGIKGLYHQRSGMELDGRFGFARPQTFHPAPSAETWDNPLTEATEAFPLRPQAIHGSKLVRFTYPQDEVFVDIGSPEAIQYRDGNKVEVPVWGGYMDAGDWDRHEMHMTPSYDLLDLADHFPEYFADLDLNLPASADVLPDVRYDGVDLPDILHEALFTVDYFRRLQQPDGGIRSGMESTGHPNQLQPSWREELDVYAYAADPKASYLYAAVAAKAAKVLQSHDATLSQMFADSAAKAFAWSEDQVVGPDGKLNYETFLSASNLRNPDDFEYLIRGTPMIRPGPDGELTITAEAGKFALTKLQIVNGPYEGDAKDPIVIDAYADGSEPVATETISRDGLGWYDVKEITPKDWKNLTRVVIRSEGPFRLKKLSATPAGGKNVNVDFAGQEPGPLPDAIEGVRLGDSSGLATVEPVFAHPGEIAPFRAWSAAELYRLTGGSEYTDVLNVQSELFIRRDAADWHNFSNNGQATAAYAYALCRGDGVDQDLQAAAVKMYTRYARQLFMADDIVASDQKDSEPRANKSSFRQARHGYTPWIAGTGVSPSMGSESIARSYILTGDVAYLKSMVQGVEFGLGSNPHNTVYTTGLGHQPVDKVLHCDAAAMGCEVPVGYTVYGPSQIWMIPNPSWILSFAKQQIYPDVYSWPVTETYHQMHPWPMLTENTVWQTNGPSTYAWGFLAAVPRD